MGLRPDPLASSERPAGASVATIPQGAALRLQLAAIAGNEPSSSFLEIRPLDRDGRAAACERAFVPVRDLDQATRRCVALADEFNVLVGVAPRTREEGTAAAVERVWTLWVDLDGAEALSRLRDFRPLPSIVIRSGSDDSAHAYWPLREPIPTHWAQRANRRLAIALNGDVQATDGARLLRAAGTLNHKHEPPRPVTCTRIELEVFTSDQVAGPLADDRRYTRRPETRVPRAGQPHSVEGLARTVREAAEGSRNHALHWAACRVRDHADAGEIDANEASESLRIAALAAGLDEQGIAATLRSALTRTRTAA
jgi:hypothetical protein